MDLKSNEVKRGFYQYEHGELVGKHDVLVRNHSFYPKINAW
jgi:hypothetical protein